MLFCFAESEIVHSIFTKKLNKNVPLLMVMEHSFCVTTVGEERNVYGVETLHLFSC